MPYVKNVDLFFHPALQKNQTQWDTNGEIFNAYGLNTSITGATNGASLRNPFTGGSQSGVPDPSSAMMIMEFPNVNPTPTQNTITLVGDDSTYSTTTVNGKSAYVITTYPYTFKSYWQGVFFNPVAGQDCSNWTEPNPQAVPFMSQINIARVDGSAKGLSVKQFIAQTPDWTDWNNGGGLPASNLNKCGLSSSNYSYVPTITWRGAWPLWGLDQR